MNKLTYKELLVKANTEMSNNPKIRYIGYGLKKGKALGTLINVDDYKIIEMPVAENLMAGFAIGLSLTGYIPIVFIERMDFILNALDSIVNHLDKIKAISRGEFIPAVIFRCVVGNEKKPLYTGITHTQDYSFGIKKLISFPVFQLKDKDKIDAVYRKAVFFQKKGISTIIVEYKDLI